MKKTGSKLTSYCLKLDATTWSSINRNRMSMVGVLHPEGISKVDYIRDAIKAYNHYIENQVIPKVQRLNVDIDEPLTFFINDGLDIERW